MQVEKEACYRKGLQDIHFRPTLRTAMLFDNKMKGGRTTYLPKTLAFVMTLIRFKVVVNILTQPKPNMGIKVRVALANRHVENEPLVFIGREQGYIRSFVLTSVHPLLGKCLHL